MSRTYSYDPGNLEGYTRDRARFELGDTLTEGGQTTAALCDEEYDAVIHAGDSKSWKMVKYRLLEAICMRLSYEVDTTVGGGGGLSYSLNQRAVRWRDMLKDAKKNIAATAGMPRANPCALGDPMYFHYEMMKNPGRDLENDRERRRRGGRP